MSIPAYSGVRIAWHTPTIGVANVMEPGGVWSRQIQIAPHKVSPALFWCWAGARFRQAGPAEWIGCIRAGLPRVVFFILVVVGFVWGLVLGLFSGNGLRPRLQCWFCSVHWLVTLSAQMTELMLPPEWVQYHDSRLSSPQNWLLPCYSSVLAWCLLA